MRPIVRIEYAMNQEVYKAILLSSFRRIALKYKLALDNQPKYSAKSENIFFEEKEFEEELM